jgi:Right handed beta helix region
MRHRWLGRKLGTWVLGAVLAGCGGGSMPTASPSSPTGPGATPTPLPSANPGSWVPPLGIPVPSFGLVEVAGATTQVVDEGHPLPERIPAGAVIEIQGTYSRDQTGGNAVVCAGTAQQPAFIRGAQGAVLTGPWQIGGSYCILEKLKLSGLGGTILAPADHIALRDVEVVGTPDGGGFWVQTWSAANTTDIVILRAQIHDNGNWLTNFDQDAHGIGVYRSADATGTIARVWILDSELFHNSGDGVQINGNQNGGVEKLHHVFVGRNVAHHNKQTGFWTKQASDVIMSENTVYAHHPSDSSPGAGLGGQYGPERVWFLYNRVYDSDVGIRMASDWGDDDKRTHYYVGNTIFRIHSTTGFNPKTGWSEACFSLIGGTNRYVVGNTCHDADSGIRTPNGSLTVAQNIFSGILSAGADVYQEGSGTMGLRRNLTDTGATYEGTPACTGCITGAPRFVNPAAGDFTPAAGSAAIDAGGPEESVYATFQTLYGLDIRNGRPAGGAWDIGSVEARAPSASKATRDRGVRTAALPH